MILKQNFFFSENVTLSLFSKIDSEENLKQREFHMKMRKTRILYYSLKLIFIFKKMIIYKRNRECFYLTLQKN